MNINNILKGGKCPCGRTHSCDIDYIYIEREAISRLTALCDKYNSILLVADENTFLAAGEKTEKALLSKRVDKVIFSGKSILIPNEEAIETVRQGLDGIELIIGIGSGVIQDLCKYVAHFAHLPYMVVATAPSMDGYASNGAAMILKGMKETVPATLPKAIVADTEILKNAPMEMIKAGYGDIIGKYSALNDWRLAHAVNGEYLCDYIYNTTYEMIEKTLKSAKGLLSRNEESVRAVTEALMVVGIMMSFATTSRPASGSEHHLSHFFEITGIINNEPYLPHGIDVFYSTYITAQIREKIVESAFPQNQYTQDRREYEAAIHKIYGAVAQGCIDLQDKVGNYKNDRVSIYNSKQKELRDILSEMPSAEKIKSMLDLVELDINELYKLYGYEKIKAAVKYAKDLKDRYTVLWMNYDLFGSEL